MYQTLKSHYTKAKIFMIPASARLPKGESFGSESTLLNRSRPRKSKTEEDNEEERAPKDPNP